ncbi:MAG TPA: peptide-methionine (R)-S-oxide reductase MsrB [Pyrinomonadaceae bacterium]|jgi:peptide-methionine (R)-S-oxide reductase
MNRRYFIKSAATLGAAAACFRLPLMEAAAQRAARGGAVKFAKIVKTDAEWKRLLTPEQYRVTRERGTEAPGSSALLKNYAKGTYVCVACALPLFSSRAKYDSHTGWPSFWSPMAKANVREQEDASDGMTRTEVLCARCDAHLGHVFDDGPNPTGLRYCMNGVALRFVPQRGRA